MLGSALVNLTPRERLLTEATARLADHAFAGRTQVPTNVQITPNTGGILLAGNAVQPYATGNTRYALGNAGGYSGVVPVLGLPSMISGYVSGLADNVVFTVGQVAHVQATFRPIEQAVLVDTFPVARGNAPDVYIVSRHGSPIAEAENEFFIAVARMPQHIRDTLKLNFSRLLEALRQEEEPVRLDLDSLRIALRFVSSIDQRMVPYFSTDDFGRFYLQWFNGGKSLVGVTFHADGLAVWSSSQADPSKPTRHTIEAGERAAELLGQILPGIAPWAFRNATARRAAA
jgi:hypothetical protein